MTSSSPESQIISAIICRETRCKLDRGHGKVSNQHCNQHSSPMQLSCPQNAKKEPQLDSSNHVLDSSNTTMQQRGHCFFCPNHGSQCDVLDVQKKPQCNTHGMGLHAERSSPMLMACVHRCHLLHVHALFSAALLSGLQPLPSSSTHHHLAARFPLHASFSLLCDRIPWYLG